MEEQHCYANSPFTCLQCCCCALLEELGRRLSQDLFVRKGWPPFNLVQGRRVQACLPSCPLHTSPCPSQQSPLSICKVSQTVCSSTQADCKQPSQAAHFRPEQLLSCGCLGWHWVRCGHHEQCGKGSEPLQDWLGLPQSTGL